jgi:hypothetical protein
MEAGFVSGAEQGWGGRIILEFFEIESCPRFGELMRAGIQQRDVAVGVCCELCLVR